MRPTWLAACLLPLLLLTGCALPWGPPPDTPVSSRPGSPGNGTPAPPPAGQPGRASGAVNPIPLPFEAQPVTPLPQQAPPEGYTRAKSLPFPNAGATVHRYTRERQVHARLEADGARYQIGEVGAYGLEDLRTETQDWTGDGRPEIHLTGSMGATWKQLRIIGFDEAEGHWVQWLATDSPVIVDLDGDGRNEIVSVSRGSLPAYTRVTRWHGTS